MGGRTTPEAMNGAPIANATSRTDSAGSGRRLSINSPENTPSTSEIVSGSANSQNSGSFRTNTSANPALIK